MTDDRSKRVQRVERELFETLSHYLLHGLQQPLPCYASVTAVEVNPNLRHAKVFFRLIGEGKTVEQAKEALLGSAPGFNVKSQRMLLRSFAQC